MAEVWLPRGRSHQTMKPGGDWSAGLTKWSSIAWNWQGQKEKGRAEKGRPQHEPRGPSAQAGNHASAASAKELPDKFSFITLQYHSAWWAPMLRCRKKDTAGNWSEWTDKVLEKSSRRPFDKGSWFFVHIDECCGLEFVIHDDEKTWDKMVDGGNYMIANPGSYQLRNGRILSAPRLGDRTSRILLQGFNWESCHEQKGWFNALREKVPRIAGFGVDLMWLPPVSASVDEHGYMPTEWFNLDSRYGSRRELAALVEELDNHSICPCADLVINHRCASRQDDDYQWTEFKNPDWSSWAICCDDPSGLGKGRPSTGMNLDYAPDIDHTNEGVQRDVRSFIAHLMNEVGFRALRIDMAKGYGPWLQEDYVESAGQPLAIAEYWEGNTDKLRDYIAGTHNRVAVFDFPTYYCLKDCIHANDFTNLLSEDGRLPGIMGCDPVRAFTFVDNHDTATEGYGGVFGSSEQVLRAYAILLTHCGTPCVFWSDWHDRGEQVAGQIEALCKIRKDVGVLADARVTVDVAEEGLYAAYINGKHGTVAVKVGDEDWAPECEGWHLRASGIDYAVWTNDVRNWRPQKIGSFNHHSRMAGG